MEALILVKLSGLFEDFIVDFIMPLQTVSMNDDRLCLIMNYFYSNLIASQAKELSYYTRPLDSLRPFVYPSLCHSRQFQ